MFLPRQQLVFKKNEEKVSFIPPTICVLGGFSFMTAVGLQEPRSRPPGLRDYLLIALVVFKVFYQSLFAKGQVGIGRLSSAVHVSKGWGQCR